MGLHKGTTNNPNGRKKGVPNKVSREMKEIIRDIVQNELDVMPITLSKLDPKEKLEIIIKLLAYVLPKLQSGDLKLEISPETITGINYIIPKED